MRHSLQEREISTVCLPCLVAPQPGHYARTHKSNSPLDSKLPVGDHGEDGSLSVCQESSHRGYKLFNQQT